VESNYRTLVAAVSQISVLAWFAAPGPRAPFRPPSLAIFTCLQRSSLLVFALNSRPPSHVLQLSSIMTSQAKLANHSALVDQVFGANFNQSDDEDILPAPERPSRLVPDVVDSADEDAITPSKPSSRKGKLSRPRLDLDEDSDDDDDEDGYIARRVNDEDDDDEEQDDEDDRRRPTSSKKRRRLQAEKHSGGTGSLKLKSKGRQDSGPQSGRVSSDRPSSSIPRRSISADEDEENDGFIDDTDAVPRDDDDEDDIIPTRGGWKNDDDIEAAPGEEEDEGASSKKPRSVFEQVLEDQKATRRPRRKEIDPMEIDAKVVEFLQRMMKARNDDVKAYASGQPALNKLAMLPEVRLMFVRHEYRESLLDHMMLAVLKCWLEPMKDGALPNIEIRSTLFEILASFKVDSTWVDRLQDSQGLGRIIHYYSKKDDVEAHRRLARKIMMAWARPFYNSNADFHDLQEDYDRNDGIAEIRQEAQLELNKLAARNQKKLDLLKSNVGRDAKDEKQKVMAEIPQKTSFLFTKMADSEVT
jgi:transcription factor SPN1